MPNNYVSKVSAKKMQFYFDDRIPRHKCAQVSENNPNGITPKKVA